MGPAAYGAMAKNQSNATPKPMQLMGSQYQFPSYRNAGAGGTPWSYSNGNPTNGPATWEVAEFGGNPLYSNYKQAAPLANAGVSSSGGISGYETAAWKQSGLPFETWLAQRNQPRASAPTSGLFQGPQYEQRMNAAEMERQAIEAKKASVAAPQAQAPVFGNTSKKALGYWGVKGY